MPIDWFPGHMVTARKEAEDALRKMDVVIEVLDARVPHSSKNPMFEALRRKYQRAALKLLNKSDLADPERTQRWLAYYNAQPGTRAVALNAKQPKAVKKIPELARALAPRRGTMLKPLRMLILGIPNVGKSTLMNTLLSRAVSKVGDEPAVTKQQQRHELAPGMWLTDTPGMLWPGIDAGPALKLAATHSIGRNAYASTEVAAALGAYLLEQYRSLVGARFGAVESSSGTELLEIIARRRGFVVKGGTLDLERAARILLGEFRDGTLGRITLETPQDLAEASAESDAEAEPEGDPDPTVEPDADGGLGEV